MTNADVIRQMSDEELYKFLQAIEIGDIDYSLTFCSLCKEDNQLDCDECFKRWLFGDADDYNGLLRYKGINSGYADRKTEPIINDDYIEAENDYLEKIRPHDPHKDLFEDDWFAVRPQAPYDECKRCKFWFGYCHLEGCDFTPIEDEPQTERNKI